MTILHGDISRNWNKVILSRKLVLQEHEINKKLIIKMMYIRNVSELFFEKYGSDAFFVYRNGNRTNGVIIIECGYLRKKWKQNTMI